MRKLILLVTAMLLLPATALAGGGGSESLCSGFTKGTTISMLDSCFSGVSHFAPSNTDLTISNDGGITHTFTAVDGSFDSGDVAPGETFTLVVDEPKVVEVFCKLHGTADGQGMAGVLIVGEAKPLAVAAPANISVIKQAFAEEAADLRLALGRIPTSLDSLADQQEELVAGLDGIDLQQAAEPATVVTVPSQSNPWLPVATGLALGLGLAALLMVRRRVGQDDPQAHSELKPSLQP